MDNSSINSRYVYLDNASTEPLSTEIKEHLISILDCFGNPSSVHSVGLKSKAIVNEARKSVAKFINANPSEIIFTSGASASNTLAIKGYVQKNDCTVLYSPLCHKSVLECVKSIDEDMLNLQFGRTHCLKVNQDGFLDIEYLKKQLDEIKNEPFLVLSYADSEIGTIQNIKNISALIHEHNGTVFLDCTGSISTIPVDVKKLNVEMLSFSGHKLGALKGIGVLYKKKNIKLEPLVYGSQEQGLFAGTENVLGIASLGKAVETYEYIPLCNRRNRDYVLSYILKNIPDSYLVGSRQQRLPNNLYVCFRGVEGESLMLLLDSNGIQVSTGSACSSGNLEPSPTLKAIGMDKKDMNSCIRITFDARKSESKEDLDYVCIKIKECVEKLRRYMS